MRAYEHIPKCLKAVLMQTLKGEKGYGNIGRPRRKESLGSWTAARRRRDVGETSERRRSDVGGPPKVKRTSERRISYTPLLDF